MQAKYSANHKRSGKSVMTAVAVLFLCVLISGTTLAAGAAKIKKLTVSSKSARTVGQGSSITVKAVVTATKAASAKKLGIKAVSSNRNIASVKIVKKPSANGKKGTSMIQITGKKAGTCEIRISTVGKNKKGKRLIKAIKVQVKKSGSSGSSSSGDSTSAKKTNDISDITLEAGQPGSNLTATYLYGGAGVNYFFTLKVGEYSGDITLKLAVGSKTAEKKFSVSKNTAYKLTCIVTFTGYQDQKLPGSMPGQYITIPATYSRFTMSFTMPDGTEKTFNKSEKGSVSSVGIGALE